MKQRWTSLLALGALTFGFGLGLAPSANAGNECLTACRQDFQECIHTCTYPYQCSQCSVIYSACTSQC